MALDGAASGGKDSTVVTIETWMNDRSGGGAMPRAGRVVLKKKV